MEMSGNAETDLAVQAVVIQQIQRNLDTYKSETNREYAEAKAHWEREFFNLRNSFDKEITAIKTAWEKDVEAKEKRIRHLEDTLRWILGAAAVVGAILAVVSTPIAKAIASMVQQT